MMLRRAVASPVGTYALFFALALLALAASRAGLVAWRWDSLASAPDPQRMFTRGLRMDLMLLCYLALIPVLLHLVLPASRVRTLLAAALLTLAGSFLLFMELVTPEFMKEFDHRPDHLFFEYLEHPREVFGMLWAHHRAALLALPLVLALAVWAQWRFWRARLAREQPGNWGRRAAVAPLVIAAMFGAARGFDHRPLNLSHAAISGNRLVNEMVPASAYTLLYAAYARRSETDVAHLYGALPWNEALARVRKYMRVAPSDFTDPAIPTLHRNGVAPRAGPPLNLVIVLEESLGAGFVGTLGGLPLTPNLDRLYQQGWGFTRLYATGTRTARGMEAVATGFPPTPAPPVLKLPRAQGGFFTLAELLRRQGYATEFVYGGVANFDNMRGFYLANGFDRVVEQQDFKNPEFLGSWGVSDEDWAQKAHATFLAYGDRPFFALMLSTTDHDPFEYPLGHIQRYEQPDFTRNNAVKYADYAIGRLFELARSAPYHARTIFVVVADHDARVYGADLVPVEHFRIPGVILGPGVPVRRDERVASQIDLGPTLLHLLGIAAEHPMTGRDLLTLPADDPGLALMQFESQHGFRHGNRLVVHQAGLPPLHFTVGPDDLLTPAGPDAELARDALAHALLPGELYKRGLYRLPPLEAPQGSR